MTQPSCRHCGTPIAPTGKRGPLPNYCSPRCKADARNQRERGQGTGRETMCRIYVDPCDICGTLTVYRRARYKRSGKRLCSPECKAEQHRRDQRRRQSTRVRLTTLCDCGNPKKPDAQRCRHCALAAQHAPLIQARRLQALRRRIDALTAPCPPMLPIGPKGRMQAAQAAPTPVRTFTAGPCNECGTNFVGVGRGLRYCTTQCRRRASDRRTTKRRGDFNITRRQRLAIYERDHWTCQLCHQPVDPDLPYEHPMSATLDHIECQAWTLIPNHSADNLRLAHRLCNAHRGDESRQGWQARLAC